MNNFSSIQYLMFLNVILQDNKLYIENTIQQIKSMYRDLGLISNDHH